MNTAEVTFMIYRSKKDAWLMCLVWGSVLVPLGLGVYNLFAPGGSPQFGWALVRIGAVVGPVLLILTYPLNYEITSTQLIARSGVMRWKVPLAAIEEVRPTRSPLSAPAWSLDRLRVGYRKNGAESALLISPEDKDRFMLDLAASTPGLEMKDGRVSRVF
jgi:hypothetical protein